MDQRERIEDRLEAFKSALDGRQATIWTALPAKVISYDPVTVTVKCRCTIQLRVTDRQGNTSWRDIPPLGEVPVCFPKAGGFRITFPLKEGDNLLVVFSSRCIDAWWANDTDIHKPQAKQLEMRMHDLSDGFAIPGPYSRPEAQLVTVDGTNFEISSEDATTRIQITPDGIINILSNGSQVQLTPQGIINLQSTQVNIISDDISLGAHIEDPNSYLVRVGDLQEWTDNLKALVQAAISNLAARVQGGAGVAPPVIGSQTVQGTSKVKGV